MANRDIKLENILLDTDSAPRPLLKIADFSYTKHDADSAAVTVVGTAGAPATCCTRCHAVRGAICRLLAAGCRLLAAGRRLLAAGCRLAAWCMHVGGGRGPARARRWAAWLLPAGEHRCRPTHPPAHSLARPPASSHRPP